MTGISGVEMSMKFLRGTGLACAKEDGGKEDGGEGRGGGLRLQRSVGQATAEQLTCQTSSLG